MTSVRRWNAGVGAGLALVLGLGLGPGLAGCGSPPPAPAPTEGVDAGPSARDQLAGLAAAAKDKRYVATYTLAAPGRPNRTVTVAIGTDGSWVVAIPGGALSGLADIALFSSSAGVFQCLIGPAAGTVGTRPDLGPMTPGCVLLPAITAATDPRVQHVFTDWIDPLTDRATALSVARIPALPGVQGACYSVESNSTALAPPVDPGVYCYAGDGVLTAAQVGFGTLTLAAPAAAAPPSVAMPAPVVNRPALGLTAPPPPPSAPSPSASH
jgi:hypothetical protein